MDRAAARIGHLVPRLWLLAATAALAPAFIEGSGPAIAAVIGANLLAFRAFRRLGLGWKQLAAAWIAWKRMTPLYDAAAREELPGSPLAAMGNRKGGVAAHDVVLSYSRERAAVLQGASIEINPGDRVILEGASGSGKSTLASVLAGLRAPQSGVVLAGGMDRHSLGERGWHRAVAFAPQFHDNHVLAGTLVFNLLLGRPHAWSGRDFQDAGEVCRQLGLGELLERMPGGLLQLVGETGWQLSHGEKSRLFLARTILQDAQVIVLDETFAALDPENFQRAVECVRRRARSVLVIAHR
jgi:ATP-binding cassette subfamily B protein